MKQKQLNKITQKLARIYFREIYSINLPGKAVFTMRKKTRSFYVDVINDFSTGKWETLADLHRRMR